ncbi:Protein charybde [Holothuria leucospilota]|uniref:Protein charybde n=1 Tax=Holothuria leucospilota TaxID=206669 RepID=A0A9Q0YJY1_HOLLE|nr:Protein charybde [Holothuria leucospilota]
MKVFEVAQVVHKPELFTMVVPVIENGKHLNISDNENSEDVSLNLDDLQDFKLTDYISSLLLDTLRTAKDRVPNLQILVPSDLAEHIARDVVCMSGNEPCGARGCALDLIIEDGEMCTRIGKCQVDPLTVTTFEVTVVLQKDVPKWFPKLQMILRNSESKTVIKPTYKLVKRKLYRKESKIHVQESS